jgi:hypothetical protein
MMSTTSDFTFQHTLMKSLKNKRAKVMSRKCFGITVGTVIDSIKDSSSAKLTLTGDDCLYFRGDRTFIGKMNIDADFISMWGLFPLENTLFRVPQRPHQLYINNPKNVTVDFHPHFANWGKPDAAGYLEPSAAREQMLKFQKMLTFWRVLSMIEYKARNTIYAKIEFRNMVCLYNRIIRSYKKGM